MVGAVVAIIVVAVVFVEVVVLALHITAAVSFHCFAKAVNVRMLLLKLFNVYLFVLNDNFWICTLGMRKLPWPSSPYEINLFSIISICHLQGRVHAAVVSGCGERADSVTVEWFENNETKGKELDIRHLAALNPEVDVALKQAAAGERDPLFLPFFSENMMIFLFILGNYFFFFLKTDLCYARFFVV
jgi:hypothetical protein